MSTQKSIVSNLATTQKAKLLILLVGTIGFEPTTPCPPDKCATKLRYAPTYLEDFNTTVEIKHYSI